MRNLCICLVLVAPLAYLACPVLSLNNGLAATPQMGWNSWNHFRCDVNETLLQQTAQAMVSTGLAAAGYTFVNIDDCWQVARNNITGEIIPDPVAFKSGIPALVKYVNDLGLELGLYSDAGLATCQGRPGSLFYETVDAETYARWGVSYLKYDNCHNIGIDPKLRYPPMMNALNATGKPIFFSMCEWGVENPSSWAPLLANSWRTTGDIGHYYESIVHNIVENDASWRVAAPGGFNDPDMLEIGNGGMTLDEEYTHMSLWSLAKAPLIIGCDVTNMTADTLAILTNPEVIAVNQDPLAIQGHRIWNDTETDVWSGPLTDERFVVLLWNRAGNFSTNITVNFESIGATATNGYTVRDLWARENLGVFQTEWTGVNIASHASQMVTLTPVAVATKKEMHKKEKKSHAKSKKKNTSHKPRSLV